MSTFNSYRARLARTYLSSFIREVFSDIDDYFEFCVLNFVQCELAIRPKPKKHPRMDAIIAPPAATYLVSLVARSAFHLGRHPAAKIEVITENEPAALAAVAQIRKILTSEPYTAIFPKTKLKTRSGPQALRTTGGGHLFVRTLDGERPAKLKPDLLIIDTPQDETAVAHKTGRDATFASFKAAAAKVAPTGSVLLLTHRVGNDDIADRLAAEAKFTIWVLPVIASDSTIYQAGQRGIKVTAGALLDPTMWDHERIAKLKRLLSKPMFAAHYLQAPLPDITE